jgi:hypothetical protein
MRVPTALLPRARARRAAFLFAACATACTRPSAQHHEPSATSSPGAGLDASSPAKTSPVTPSPGPAEIGDGATTRSASAWEALFAANVAATRAHGPTRLVLAPGKRPYIGEIRTALGRPLDEKALAWFAPSPAEIEPCERRFLEMARAELEARKVAMVPRDQARLLALVFEGFPRYERQAVGWSFAGDRYVYLRFRLPATWLPPLTEEYRVRDGGHAFFEMQCKLPTSIFGVLIHGDA